MDLPKKITVTRSATYEVEDLIEQGWFEGDVEITLEGLKLLCEDEARNRFSVGDYDEQTVTDELGNKL